ncbi:MAG TPA: C25 family cysteine peptidase, partial [Saprospiraceae bacterium]|nr:C25 family cysteine peptidase [Saprospiraceae bacterium]
MSTTALSPKKLYAAGPPATVSVRYACQSGMQHQQRITVNDTVFADDNFSDWRLVQRTFQVPLSLIPSMASVKIKSQLSSIDRHAVSGVSLRYPRQFDFENATYTSFALDASPDAQYLEIQAFNVASGTPVLYDLTNKIRLETIVEGGVVKVKITPSATERQMILLSPTATKTVGSLQPVQFRDYRPENADYVIVSNPALYNDNGTDHVAAFAAYRESAAGGNRKVAVVDVNELYEQFAYGVRYHPIALRNFLHYAEKQWPDLRHVFLIGKGLDYSQFRVPATQAALADSLFFLPTYGSPAADMPFVFSNNQLSEPVAAIGRLAVTRPQDIGAYLEKVKSHELTQASAAQTIEEKAWMKRVIHNSGGLAGETGAIKVYTSDMANVLSNNRFGADVHTFYKTSNDPIQLSSYEQMLDLINGGVSLWSIYGHSSAFAVDFDIGSPSVYNNTGRYPLMMIMGCFSGLCSSPQQGIGEQFVLAPDRGAIAYIASVNYSYITALHDYGRKFYELLGGADYGKSVGEVFQHTIGALEDTDDNGLIAVLHQNLLQGDPAVAINVQPGPDYLIDKQTVKFDPNPVGLEQNTFKLNFNLTNIGENTGSQIALKIEQRLPDNTVLSRITDTVMAPPFSSALEYALPVAGSKIGFNRFFITLDPENKIEEKPFAAELNNELTDATGEKGVDVYFYSDDVQAIYPPAYGIVRAPDLTLRASTLNTN